MCCCGSADDGCDADTGNPGPDITRRCTDVCCVLVLLVFFAWPVCAILCLKDVDGAYSLTHGHDHYGHFCGRDSLEDKAFAFFPDLENDFKEDPTLLKRYGVCVEKCPKQFEVITDYAGTGGTPLKRPQDLSWYVSLPTFPVAGRCIPYDPPANFSASVEFCADPQCHAAEKPSHPQEVCGLAKDGTNRFWLISKADDILADGWRREGLSDEAIRQRAEIAESAAQEPCKVKVLRDTRVRTEYADASITYSILTKYTGYMFTWSATVYENRSIVLGLGLGGSLVLSLVIITGFAYCVGCVLNVLITCLFLVLICVDYVLFLQAGLVTGRSGRLILDSFGKAIQVEVPDELTSLLEASADTEELRMIYKWCAIGLAIGIFLLACAALAARKNFQILVELLKEASNTMREMPSLLLTPFILACSMMAVSLMMLWVALSISTLQAMDVPEILEAWKGHVAPALVQLGFTDDPLRQLRQIALVFNLFVFLFSYYFHVALCISITAMCVSHWYFYRDDRDRNAGTGINSDGWFFGRPVLLAFQRICRHHIGSLVFGSCIMSVATLLRLAMEYVAAKTKDAQDGNPVVRALVCTCRCCLWCLEKCLQFITEYAYVYVAVTGKPFCSAARSSFVFFAKYPLQTALDKMASTVLGYLLCVTVPGGLAVAAFLCGLKTAWPVCAVVIFGLAYVTTRLAAGIYDVCVTTLFVCAMRDCEHYGGRYMSKSLKNACGFAELARASLSPGAMGIELQDAS
ncbi:unnamed protein product [Effrenium voratum]|uniref:Choline transporter-like protein n=1 Tax=Effrenium voratum TaxID=2562239 RepID=A0AA36JQT2_9DINO|nr:unnamed protein product [Effrenium voratum]CAJ1417636.1 unnamed protein product [Effrenium voratum]